MSSPWRVLGIPKGSDRSAIRRGYARKLKITNPEDDPEKFKRLREAYEHALQMASWNEHEFADQAEDPTPAGQDDDPALVVQQPAPPPEPVDPEAEELDGLVEALDVQLASPWRDDVRANALFDQILGHSGMDSLDGRTRVEFRIGSLIASRVPASDALLLLAIRTFEWNRVGRAEQWPFVAALNRHEEWKLIAAFERPGHRFHRAWRALTTPPATRWSRAALAHSHHGPRIAELLDIIDYQSNGLLPSTLPAEVAWWRARTDKGTIAIASYAWAVLVGALVWGVLTLTGASSLMAIGLGVANAIVLAFDRYGIERGYQRLGIWWNRQQGPRRTLWQVLMRGWPLLMAVVPFLALLLPVSWWATVGVTLLCAIAVFGLRLSGDGQMTPLAMVWGAATLLIVTLAVAAGSQLPPLLPRFVMLIAVGGLLVQPLIAARPVLLELADARSRNHGAFLFLAYAAAFAATCWWAWDRGLADIASATTLAALVLWVLSPLIAASHLIVANIASRIVRGLTFFIVLTMAGLLNPLSVGSGMSNGEAIVALHLGLSGDPLPRTAAAMAEMQSRNPLLYARVQRALPVHPVDDQRIERASMTIDGLIDTAVRESLDRTSDALAGRYQRGKSQALMDKAEKNAAECAGGRLVIDDEVGDWARRELLSTMLAIAARGPVQGSGRAEPMLIDERRGDLRALRQSANKLLIEPGALRVDRDKCIERIIRDQALANMPDAVIAATLAAARDRPVTRAPAAPPRR